MTTQSLTHRPETETKTINELVHHGKDGELKPDRGSQRQFVGSARDKA
jgi:hypothetical protein